MTLQALQDLQGELDALSSGCSAINAALAADRTSSADLLAESDKLQHELAVSETRSGLVNSFFEQYQLSSAEISALQVRAIHSSTCCACCFLFDCLQGHHQHCKAIISFACAALARLCAMQDADIGDTFFNALERVGSIHRSCRNLLSSHHHRAGLELMDAMSTYQETAYERLCRCHSLSMNACMECGACQMLNVITVPDCLHDIEHCDVSKTCIKLW